MNFSSHHNLDFVLGDSPHRTAEEAVDASSTSFEQLGNARTTDASSSILEQQLGNSRKTVGELAEVDANIAVALGRQSEESLEESLLEQSSNSRADNTTAADAPDGEAAANSTGGLDLDKDPNYCTRVLSCNNRGTPNPDCVTSGAVTANC